MILKGEDDMENTKKVPLLNKIAYGAGTGGGAIFSQIGAAFLLAYYTDSAMIGAGAIATMFLICRIFDGISDLVMGGIVDKTNTRWGKARPWLILSGPLFLVGMVLLMNVPSGFSDAGKLVYAYITYIFMNVFVYTIYGIANTALLPLITRNFKETTNLAFAAGLGNNIIGLVAGSVITPMVIGLGWRWTSIILGLISCALILFSGIINKETATEMDKKGPKTEKISMKEQFPTVIKNRYFWLLLLLGVTTLLLNGNAIGAQIYFCNIVLGNPLLMSALMTAGMVPGIIILFAMPVISNKWSKQVFLLLGAICVIIGFVITGFAGTNTTVIIIGTVVRAIGLGPLMSGVPALIPEVVEYGNWKYGVRSEGLISSAQSIGAKIGIGIGSALTGWILAAVGYTGGGEITDKVKSAISFDFTWLGAILGVLILLVVLALNVEKYAPEYRKENKEVLPEVEA